MALRDWMSQSRAVMTWSCWLLKGYTLDRSRVFSMEPPILEPRLASSPWWWQSQSHECPSETTGLYKKTKPSRPVCSPPCCFAPRPCSTPFQLSSSLRRQRCGRQHLSSSLVLPKAAACFCLTSSLVPARTASSPSWPKRVS